MSTELEDEAPRAWSRMRQDIGRVVWCGFLAAAAGTMVFFACFDPAQLGDDAAPPSWLADRMTGYALGFFFFWMMCTAAAALAAWLIEARPVESRSPRDMP